MAAGMDGMVAGVEAGYSHYLHSGRKGWHLGYKGQDPPQGSISFSKKPPPKASLTSPATARSTGPSVETLQDILPSNHNTSIVFRCSHDE